MKIFPPCIIGIALICASGCKDIGETTPDPEQRYRPGYQNTYPLDRTITDSQGRGIEVTILGKRGLEIAFSKGAGDVLFIVPLERLSKPDQDYFDTLDDGGRFSEVKETLEKEARFTGRVARWNRDTTSAEREAAKLNLPILIVFLIAGNEESAAIQKNLNFSNEFRDWAKSKLVLCMLEVDDPGSNRTTSFSAVENRNAAAKYGVVTYEGPTVMLVKPDNGTFVKLSHISINNPKTAINSISSALRGNLMWGTIVVQEAPKKARAKVNPATEEAISF